MKKNIIIALVTVSALSGCNVVTTEPGFSTVLVDKPYIFGNGGLRNEVYPDGRFYTWMSTADHQISIRPNTRTEVFDDLTTAEGSYVDFTTSLTLTINDPVAAHQLGDKWYENNLQRAYQEIVRNEVRKFSLSALRTEAAAQEAVEKAVRTNVNTLIVAAKLPIKQLAASDINLGKATPNKEVQAQIDLTTAQEQREKTMSKAQAAEVAREKAELARANADNAYRNKMDLSPDQFLQLESIKRYSEACKTSSCNLIFGSNGAPVLLQNAKK